MFNLQASLFFMNEKCTLKQSKCLKQTVTIMDQISLDLMQS